MKFAYADPPYIGQEHKYDGPGVNHPLLIDYLCNEFDGWALSCSSPTLHQILPMCPSDVRVGAWVKPFAIFKPNVNPGYTWEPVIFWHPKKRERCVPTVRDFVSCNITLKKGFTGAKPHGFSYWIFDLLGIDPKEDEFTDMFFGSGAVTEAFKLWQER